MRLLILSILFSFVSFSSFSQEDLTGTWEGTGSNLEYAMICIIRYNNTYIGFTYDEGMGHCKCHFLGEYDPEKKNLKGVNKGVIKKTFTHVQSRYNLDYVIINGREYLKGTIAPKTALMGFPLPIRYTRTSSKVDTTDYMLTWLKENVPIQPGEEIAKQEPVIPVKPVPPSPVAIDTVKTITQQPVPTIVTADSIILAKNKRVNDTLSIFNTSAKELVIKVMDNGVIDGDIVSIIHNGKVIAEKIYVKAIPNEIKIPMTAEDNHHEIILVAHNLGSISPNTALIVIDTPEKQFRLTASTDLTKNAMIIFNYQE